MIVTNILVRISCPEQKCAAFSSVISHFYTRPEHVELGSALLDKTAEASASLALAAWITRPSVQELICCSKADRRMNSVVRLPSGRF